MNTHIPQVLIVDDHHMFLEGLSALLSQEQNIEIKATLKNGKEVIEFLKKDTIDLILMDISMPEMDGIELNKYIKTNHPDIKTMVLSTHSDPKIINKIILDGANGYLLKNADKSELLEAIDTLQKGENYFSDEVKQKYTESFFGRKPGNQDKNPPLSRREIEILKLIVAQDTTQEIAEKLFISQHTVNSHRKNLLSKLGLKNTAGLVKYALEEGIA
ncbi:response regulator transcription factor [Marinigracilibium pacificum]|uniref:Response regulator transcription factor n=1 Tax=Marinigracilibium pacificum TaxID=2729599 RepID=A0A848IW46_9BACT|nr:response regulator transcription factor [Marinigracilibium pacificum]NMM48733.1 response regulator transcription factor [Marinigracilibium pacificum]